MEILFLRLVLCNFEILLCSCFLFCVRYHHVTVLLYTWYSIAEVTASGRWFVTLNYIVHTFMYAYYALRAMRIRVPRRVAMGITVGQVLRRTLCFLFLPDFRWCI